MIGDTSKNRFVTFSVLIMLLYANYNTLIDGVIGTKLRMLLLVGALFIGLFPYVLTGIRQKHIDAKPIALWSAFIAIIVLNNNRDINGGTLFFTLRILIALLFICYVNINGEWMVNLSKYVVLIGSANIFATFFFFVFRGAYRIMCRFYGYYPTGTDQGKAGYRAGIANHYSQNATYIVYVFIVLAALTLAEKNKDKKKKLLMLSGVALFALLLTSKRAHLLFSFAALLGAYFILSDGKSIVKAMKLLALGAAGVGLFILLGQFIQPIADIISRFSTAGTDNESMARFAMWKLCIDNFRTKPILGVGWAQFPQLYYENLYVPWYDEIFKFLNAHNVYLQVLCESGIIGFIVFMSIITYNFTTVLKGFLAIKNKDIIFLDRYKSAMVVSLAVQMFFVLYCATGNGLYDYSFYFYMLASAAGLAISKRLKAFCIS